MDVVNKTEPHFVRCIKPNPQNLSDVYDRPHVTEQLRYGGVLQVVQVSRAGYPVRINHVDCWMDYRVIASLDVINRLKPLEPKERASKLLEHLTLELSLPKTRTGLCWAVGKTLVFFKQEAFEILQGSRLGLRNQCSTTIQAHWRRMRQQKLYKVVRKCAIHVQALLKGKEMRMEAQLRRE